MENYVIFEIIQYNILVVPSSDGSTKCSNLHAEQTGFFVFTTLSNSVKDCIIDLKKPQILCFLFASHGCAPVFTETTIIVLSFMKLTFQISLKHLSMIYKLLSR